MLFPAECDKLILIRIQFENFVNFSESELPHMKCTICGAEYPDGGKCPVCSGGQEPPKPEKSNHVLRIVLTVGLCLAVVVVLACIIFFASPKTKQEKNTTEPSASESTQPSESADPSTEPTDPSGEETPFTPTATGDSASPAAKAVYAVQNITPQDPSMAEAVAQFEGGTLTNGELNVYIWSSYYDLVQTYGDVAAYLGLDGTKPLYEQASVAPVDEADEESSFMSGEQYLLQTARQNYCYYKGLELTAKAEGFVLPEEYQKNLDGIHANLEQSAKNAGFDSVDAYVQKMFGSGTCEADFVSYQTTYLTAYAYFEEVLIPKCTPTDDEVNAYFDENAEAFAQQGLTKTDKADRSIRHILIKTEKDVDSDGDGKNDTCSEEVIAAAKAKAEELYAKWQENPTEENFAELAKENSADGNAAQGGLYDDVFYGMMVQSFNDWCFDDARKVGDHGIVQTDYGFHLMYFSGFRDNFYWFDTAKQALESERAQTMSQELADKQTITFDFSKVVICDLVSENLKAE